MEFSDDVKVMLVNYYDDYIRPKDVAIRMEAFLVDNVKKLERDLPKKDSDLYANAKQKLDHLKTMLEMHRIMLNKD